jgi:hypothetical protein
VVRGVESLPCAKSKDPAFGTCGRHELAAPPNSRSPVPRSQACTLCQEKQAREQN